MNIQSHPIFYSSSRDLHSFNVDQTQLLELRDNKIMKLMMNQDAILKSKKYSWIDDYAIYNHYDPLNLSQSDLELAENQLSSVLKTTNPKLDALNEKIAKLSEELEQTKYIIITRVFRLF